jgi:hypothetical protein
MSFIPKVKMDFVPEETEENEEELIPEAVPTTEEINPNDIFEETKPAKKEEPKKETIIEETIIEEEPPKEPVKKPRKKREYTEEQRQAMRERMAKVREARKIKGKSKKQEEQPVNRPIQEPTPQPIQQPQPLPQPIIQPEQPKFIQPQVNQQQAQEAIEKMIFAGIQSYEVLRKERKAKKKEAEKKQKEHEDFKNTLKRAMNRKNTNPYGNSFF